MATSNVKDLPRPCRPLKTTRREDRALSVGLKQIFEATVFTGESPFLQDSQKSTSAESRSLCGVDGRRRVWRQRSTAVVPCNIQETVPFGTLFFNSVNQKWALYAQLNRPLFTGITVNGTRNVIVNEHETVSFQCDVHSIPPPSSICVQQKETNSIHDVVIKDINCTHTGTYVCVARNVVGETTGKETVTIYNVISQPRRCDSSDKYVEMSYDSKSVSGTFLVCSYPGPVNHIMEYLDKGINVIDTSDSPRHTLSMHKGKRFYTFTFSISRMQTRDLGTYRLSVVNEKGTLELFVQLFDQGQLTN
ncbi:uncharacterized protein LOC124114859 [Haliotis rufescens]|uniref:uncharacterized protein LOC124114859 n=1 Tax=Haliotis rufescens TaxID=6454 RepID=UPI00201F1A9D|nr:uncharacterized protein LOC124114859 [Haliotis rufescens]